MLVWGVVVSCLVFVLEGEGHWCGQVSKLPENHDQETHSRLQEDCTAGWTGSRKEKGLLKALRLFHLQSIEQS